MSNFDDRRLLGAFREQLVAELTPVVQIKFPYNLHSQFVDTAVTGSGTVVQNDSKAQLSTTAASSSSATLVSHDTAVYQPGQGIISRFTLLLTSGVAGSNQTAGIGDDVDGFFIGCNGADFGVLRRHNGTDHWTYLPNVGDGSADFIGQLDLTKGNVFQIQYQWLGFGQIIYSVFSPDTQSYEVLFIDKYNNTSDETSIHNPNLPMCFKVENTTNDTNIVLQTASAAIFIEGKATQLLSRHAVNNQKTITSETNILTIRNKTTYHSITNRAIIFPDLLSVASDGTKIVKYRIYKNTTLGGSPSYSDVDAADSIAEYDTAGTTVTGGDLLMIVNTDKTGSSLITFDKSVKIHSGETITITAESVSSTISDVALSWKELI